MFGKKISDDFEVFLERIWLDFIYSVSGYYLNP